MKTIVIKLIRVYQVIISVLLKNLLGVPRFCRFNTTCSEYAVESIREHGVLRGGYRAITRVLKCQPFYGGVTV